MRDLSKYLLLCAFTILLWGCGGGDSFRITGEIPGIGTQNLNIVYYGDGSLHSTRTAVVDGKFMFDGKSRDWTTVYFFTNTRSLIGIVIVKDGENVDAHFELNNLSATVMNGTKPSELLSDWLQKNGETLKNGSATQINEGVKAFVEKNRDNIASTVLLVNFYRMDDNPRLGDSLMQIISPKARPGYMADWWKDYLTTALDSSRISISPSLTFLDVADTLRSVVNNGKTILLYSPGSKTRNEVFDNRLKTFQEQIRKDSLSIGIIEIDRGITDTLSWKRSVRGDSLPWMRVWHPLNSMEVPFVKGDALIVADSAGNIIYNGNDLEQGIRNANSKNR